MASGSGDREHDARLLAKGERENRVLQTRFWTHKQTIPKATVTMPEQRGENGLSKS